MTELNARKLADDIIAEFKGSPAYLRVTRVGEVLFDAYLEPVDVEAIELAIDQAIRLGQQWPSWFLFGGRGPWFEQCFGTDPSPVSAEIAQLAEEVSSLVQTWLDTENTRLRDKALREAGVSWTELAYTTSSRVS